MQKKERKQNRCTLTKWKAQITNLRTKINELEKAHE